VGFKVVVTDPLSEHGLAVLRSVEGFDVEEAVGLDSDALREKVRTADAWVVRSGTPCTGRLIEAAERLLVIARAGISVDNVDVDAATRRGVVVMNTPGVDATSAAEHTLALMLTAARRIPAGQASLRTGMWKRERLVGRELRGKTLGIVGLGTVGRIVADRARGMRMKAIAADPYVAEQDAETLGVRLVHLDELLAESDVITLHVPKKPETLGLIDDEALAKTKPGVILVSCARDGIVDEDALVDALDSGHVFAAAIDVWAEGPPPPEHPLLGQAHVVATPHQAAATLEAQEAMAVAVAEQVRDFLLDGVVRGAVNTPSLAGETLERLRQYQDLCQRTGTLASQLLEGDVSAAEVVLQGEVADLAHRPLGNAILIGLLSPYQAGVNAVNAPLLAAERGLTVDMHAETGAAGSVITLRVAGHDGERTVVGTLFAGNPRIIRIDGFAVEVAPVGKMLVHISEDRPGLVGAVGTMLGQHGVSGTGLYAGVDREGYEAIALWNVDSHIEDDVLADVSTVPGMLLARRVEF